MRELAHTATHQKRHPREQQQQQQEKINNVIASKEQTRLTKQNLTKQNIKKTVIIIITNDYKTYIPNYKGSIKTFTKKTRSVS